MSPRSSYPSGISQGRKSQGLSGAQDNKAPEDPAALARKVLSNPSYYPDEFLAFLPDYLKYNVNFKVLQASLPLNGAIHLVGGTGEAAVFQNSWVNFGTSDAPASYYIDPWGVVHLKGTVKSGTLNTTIFTLPAGFRPQVREIFAVVCNGVFGAVDVSPTGAVAQNLGGSNVYLTISGITFRQFA